MGAAAACQDILPQVLDAVEGGAGGGEEHLAVGVAEKQAGGALGDLDGVDVPGGNPLLQILVFDDFTILPTTAPGGALVSSHRWASTGSRRASS